MGRTDPSALEAQAAADRDHGALVTVAQCRERYGLTDAELTMLGPPRIGAPRPGSGEPTQVFRIEVVLELLERLRPARAPAAVHDDEVARGAA